MDLKLNQNTYTALEKAKTAKGVLCTEYRYGEKKTTLLDMGVTTPIKGKTAEKLGLLAADSAMGLLGKPA